MRMLIGLLEETDIPTKQKNHLKQLGLFSSLFFFGHLFSTMQN